MDLELGATPELRNGPRRSIEHPFGLIIESLPIALVLTGPGGLIEIVNREAEVMFGYDRTRATWQIARPADPRAVPSTVCRPAPVFSNSRVRGHG